MIRLLLRILPLIAFVNATRAQNLIFIPINNQECTSCLEHASYLAELNKNEKPTLIFEKRYRRDSTALLKRLHLEAYHNDLTWSDSLYNIFKNNFGLATNVSLFNKESGKIIKTSFLQIEKNIRFINNINKRRDTFTLESPAFSSESSLVNSGAYFYVFDGITKEVRVFEKSSGSHLYDISLTDSLIKTAFQLRFGVKWQRPYDEMIEYTRKFHSIDNQAYTCSYFTNDTAYLLGVHGYLLHKSDGAPEDMQTQFYSMSTFKSGKCVDFSIVENYVEPAIKNIEGAIPRVTESGVPVKDKNAYYQPSGQFTWYNGDLYMVIQGRYSKGIPNHFLAKFKRDKKDKDYRFLTFYDKVLPPIYDSFGYNFITPQFFIPSYGPFVALSMSDSLFSLSDSQKDIWLQIFPSDNWKRKASMWDIKVSPGYAYAIYMDYADRNYHYVKYDRANQKVLIDRPICDYKAESFIATPKIDDFDHSNVYIPISENQILRLKVASAK